MQQVGEVRRAEMLPEIRGAWVHNNELIIQHADDELQIIATFTAQPKEHEPKVRKPRAAKNGLGAHPLGETQPAEA